jgi:alpha-tubulin suppressor-like RCC1 family protein
LIFSLTLQKFLFCRGSGEDGQLGIGTNEDKEWVCTVKALPSQRVRSVVAGSRNSLAICHDGKVINISQVVTLFWDMETTYDLSIG